MAGGKGTRLSAYTQDLVPKPMAMVAGKPILQWQIESLRDNGIHDFIMITGYLGNVISDYFGDGKAFDVSIKYYQENAPLGTAGALGLIREMLTDSPFFLAFGDIIFDISIEKMRTFHNSRNAVATLFTHPNAHPFDSDVIVKDKDAYVSGILKKSEPRSDWYENCTNAGLYMLEREICTLIPPGKSDLEKDVILPLINAGKAVYAYQSPEYVKDVGTIDRIEQADKDLSSGVVARKNLSNKQKAVFLDRDGTINRFNGLVYKEEQFVLEACAAEAIRKINRSGYLAIVISNQPSVARGLCQIGDIENIHRKMQTLLGKEGAYLDDVLFCPHHPDKGYPEENPLYKIACDCRKPGVGLIEKCVGKYNIDLSSSWFVGDTSIDIQTGKNAGTRTILVHTGEAGRDGKFSAVPDLECSDLLDAINIITEG